MSRKLSAGEKHLLRLIKRDRWSVDFDRRMWATVSDAVLPLVRAMPAELVVVLAGGEYVRLTELGEHVVEAMEWL